MEIRLELCSFEDVLPVWRSDLWPQRQSAIEPISCINSSGQIDMQILEWTKQTPPFFWRLLRGDKVVGTISLHRTGRREGRLRGLWIHPDLRGTGQARRLIAEVLRKARRQGLREVWVLGREQVSGVYRKQGFTERYRVTAYEFGPHILCAVAIPPRFSIFSVFSRVGS